MSRKPERRIIVLKDIPTANQTKEHVTELFKRAAYENHILKIEQHEDSFQVFFKEEPETIEIFKWLEKEKQENVISN